MAGIKRRVRRVLDHHNKEISSHASRGRVASGLAGEGWNGGYAAALRDVLQALDGVEPRNWEMWIGEEK